MCLSRLHAYRGTRLYRAESPGFRGNRASEMAQLSKAAARNAACGGTSGSKSASHRKRAMEEALQRREAQPEAEMTVHRRATALIALLRQKDRKHCSCMAWGNGASQNNIAAVFLHDLP